MNRADMAERGIVRVRPDRYHQLRPPTAAPARLRYRAWAYNIRRAGVSGYMPELNVLSRSATYSGRATTLMKHQIVDVVKHGPVLCSAFARPERRTWWRHGRCRRCRFMVHIPLVCSGSRFPVMVPVPGMALPAHRYQLSGCWPGVDEGHGHAVRGGRGDRTILSFEMGLLWPNFRATFGPVFGLGFAIEGFSFFLEAIFIGIYVYGWTGCRRGCTF